MLEKKKKNIRKRKGYLKRGKLKLNNRTIDVHCFGIGGYFGTAELKELAHKWNKHLSNDFL